MISRPFFYVHPQLSSFTHLEDIYEMVPQKECIPTIDVLTNESERRANHIFRCILESPQSACRSRFHKNLPFSQRQVEHMHP